MKRQNSASSGNSKKCCRPTRSTNRSGDWHQQSSEIHRAIEARDLDLLKKLLANGEQFCYGDGLNCFILAALSPQGQTLSRWKFVVEMLKLDAKGLTAKNEDGKTLLMIYCNSKEKIRHLIHLGADVNAVDQNGHSALLTSFLHPSPKLDAFEELLKHVESNDEVRVLIDSLINELPSVANSNVATAVQMIISVLSNKPVDLSTFTFEQHPLKRVMDLHKMDSKKRYCLLLGELVTRHLQPGITVLSNVLTEPAWRDVFEQFNIPNIAQLDLSGYFFYTLNFSHRSNIANNEWISGSLCCSNMGKLVQKCHYIFKKRNVLNPIVALILKIFQEGDPDDSSNGPIIRWDLRNLTLSIIKFHLKVPNRRKEPIYDADNILRLVARLMAFSYYDIDFLISSIMRCFLPNSSIHPYAFLAMCVENITSKPNHEQRLAHFYSYIFETLWLSFLDVRSSGVQFEGVAGLPGGLNFVRLLREMERQQDPEVQYVTETGSSLKTSVCSLKELSKWAFRAAVADFVKYKPLHLISYINKAGTKGFIPKSLVNYSIVQHTHEGRF